MTSHERACDGIYRPNAQGIWTPPIPPDHRDEEYDSASFKILRAMQNQHFWYLGRHRFILRELRRMGKLLPGELGSRSAIDLGGGTGGWVAYARQNLPDLFAEWALADSSLQGLELAEQVVGENVRRYQIDLLKLGWNERWDAAFMLDVLEHIPQDADALAQVRDSLRPGGLLFVTTPAFPFFWSYNDDLASHQRRYRRRDFQKLADGAGLELCDSRYFMFLLSPLYYLARLKKIDVKNMSPEEIKELVARTHGLPSKPVNAALRAIFSAETPLGHYLRFPWGTSILGVFRKK